IAVEGEKNWPHHVVEAAVGDAHVEDRLCFMSDAVPYHDGLKQPPRGGGDGGRACVGRWMSERRIDDRDRKASAERLAQRSRQRKAGEARATDQHVGIFHSHQEATLAVQSTILSVTGCM